MTTPNIDTDPNPTTVIHVRDMQPDDIYIGRAVPRRRLKASPFANPFKPGPDGSRDEVMAKYRAHITARPDLLAQLPALRGHRLACWCAPESCHGDILVELLQQQQEEQHPINQPTP